MTRRDTMKALLGVLVVAASELAVGAVHAQVKPITVRIPESTVWTGQRLGFFVELRVRGSFGGATRFILPTVPRTVIMKPDSPVVSSEEIEGETWFVQTHEFALFSQGDGVVEIPPFPVHFGTRDDFDGPVTEVEAEVPAIQVQIERPPGTDGLDFIVTTAALDISEQWDPPPTEPVEAGAIFKRTIRQRADGVTGMALAPAPTTAPAGIRVYPGEAEVRDQTERGELSGERVETLTYLIEQPGRHTLPAIRYTWWNPETKTLESKTLAAVSFTATAPPALSVSDSPANVLWLLFALLVLAGFGWFYRTPFMAALKGLHERIDPPQQRAARALLRACQRDDVVAAISAWSAWARLQPGFVPTGELRQRIHELQRHRYGLSPQQKPWRGEALASAFRRYTQEPAAPASASALPPLNPTSGMDQMG